MCRVILCLLFAATAPATADQKTRFEPFVWPEQVPDDCPFEPSTELTGLRFTGVHSDYPKNTEWMADTWYPSWAADGNLYSPYTDGPVGGRQSNSNGWEDHPNGSMGEFNSKRRPATTAQAVMIGDDPLNLEIKPVGGLIQADPYPYGGRYPCGSLVHDGVWYYGTYCLSPHGATRFGSQLYNWPWLGPLVGFRVSTDGGETWKETEHTPAKPLFGESGMWGHPVKIGAPHFVDFGKNMEHSPDGKAYLVAQGAVHPDEHAQFANLSWITADQVYLLRVTPSPRTINDPSDYEFYGGTGTDGAPVWTKDFAAIKPLLEWNNNMGCVTVTYNAPLKKYIMCVTDGENTCSYMNTYLLEADALTGPWKLIVYMKHFGEQAYFVNIPSKFISNDGRTMWLCYSANFASDWNGLKIKPNPPGSKYGLVFQQFELLTNESPR